MIVTILGRLSLPISLNATGGTELFCALLAKGMVERGHTVNLLASETSERIEGTNFIPVVHKHLFALLDDMKQKFDRDPTADDQRDLFASLTLRSVMTLLKYAPGTDIIHANLATGVMNSVSDLLPAPTVATMHLPASFRHVEVPSLITEPKVNIVAVSDYQKKVAGRDYDRVYNGINIDEYPFFPAGGEPLFWIGRVARDTPKGITIALEVSSALKKRLIVAANITDQEYYQNDIVPLKHPLVEEVGQVTNPQQKAEIFGNSKALIYPIQWEEPFGLVFAEAMATGTPVIAFARGATPEIIVDGQTGFLVNPSDDDIRGDFLIKKTGTAGIQEAVEHLYNLSSDQYRLMRQASRQRVIEHFTYKRMCEEYEVIYNRLLSRRG